MKKTTIFFACIVMSTLFSTVGCRKFTHEPHPSDPPSPPKCLIDWISYQGASQVDTIRFTNNADGNPTSGFRTNINFANNEENYYWRYDASGKLTDMVELYNRDTVNFTSLGNWHKLSYDTAGNIVLDTLYVMPHYSGGHISSYFALATIQYGYDAQHRMRSALGVEGTDTVQNESFLYLTDNMFGKPYDDSVSIYSTSKIWQWLGRDYSVSNPVDWLSWYPYNGHGLPNAFVNIYPEHTYRFFKSSAGDGLRFPAGASGYIHYTCDAPAAPAGKAY